MTHYVQFKNGARRSVSAYVANVLALSGRVRYVLRTDSVEILELMGARADLRVLSENF